MREGIHPEYHETKVHCSCGNEWVTRSTRKNLRVELCSACHPFFTGKQRFVDTMGRIERFQRKFKLSDYFEPKKAKVEEEAAEETAPKVGALEYKPARQLAGGEEEAAVEISEKAEPAAAAPEQKVKAAPPVPPEAPAVEPATSREKFEAIFPSPPRVTDKELASREAAQPASEPKAAPVKAAPKRKMKAVIKKKTAARAAAKAVKTKKVVRAKPKAAASKKKAPLKKKAAAKTAARKPAKKSAAKKPASKRKKSASRASSKKKES